MTSHVNTITGLMPLLRGLPILGKSAEFLRLIADNPVVIVEAETGSGKSTGLPPILLEAGYNVLQTQPREMAARLVAQRIAEVCNVELGGVVGYRTAQCKDMDGAATKCLVVTDGLALVRRLLNRSGKFQPGGRHRTSASR